MKTDSQTPDTDEKRPRRRRRRWVCWLLALLFLPTVSVLAYKEYRYRREIALMRAEGLPTSLAELEAWRGKLKPEEDATDLWLEIAAEYERAKALPDPVTSPDGIDALQEALDRTFASIDSPAYLLPGQHWPLAHLAIGHSNNYSKVLKLVRKARLNGGHVRLPATFDGDLFSELRYELAFAAAIACHRNDPMEIGGMFKDTIYMASIAGQCQQFVDCIDALQVRHIALNSILSRYLMFGDVTKHDLVNILEAISAIDIPGEIRLHHAMDRVFIVEGCPSFCVASVEVPGIFIRDDYLRFYRESQNLCDRRLAAEGAELDKLLAEATDGIIGYSIQFDIGNSPSLYPYVQIQGEEDLNTAKVAIAIRKYWDAHRHVPENLAVLDRVDIINPASGVEYGYEIVPNIGVRLTSGKADAGTLLEFRLPGFGEVNSLPQSRP